MQVDDIIDEEEDEDLHSANQNAKLLQNGGSNGHVTDIEDVIPNGKKLEEAVVNGPLDKTRYGVCPNKKGFRHFKITIYINELFENG